ncbi:XrtA/PEP-CTERM system histidine kinase PrsK [uncultured Sphingomonas sp.]|uniref:XrtA/PEP-CTERM system histidine kinase PrsK n=1 Tax=uncultured Sphingomonas sp. TaxID=158754 RepID=UPI0035CACBF7
MVDGLILWGHALAAILFAVLALSQLRQATTTLPRLAFTLALALSALSALAVAGIDQQDLATRLIDGLRQLAWLGFMFALFRRAERERRNQAIAMIYGVVVAVEITAMALAIVETAFPGDAAATAIGDARLALKMMVAVGALVLVNHLYMAVRPQARSGIPLALGALAILWASDLAVGAANYLTHVRPADVIALRGLARVASVPLFAVAAHRNGDWTLKLSRSVAWQSLSIAGFGLYALATIAILSTIDAVGGAHARQIEAAFVFGSTAALLALLSTPKLKAWVKVKVAKHLFRHRYDYRAEWTRFTETLGAPGEGAAPLDERIVKAVADVTYSPAGLLLVADGATLVPGAGWRWDAAPPSPAGGGELARRLAGDGRIVELDPLRAGRGDPAERSAIPQWILDQPASWAIVPLIHLDQLIGAIVLARPPIDRALDWEDYDLLRMAGRQVASYLAEARAHDALADAERFDEFNRRFAFIMHDVKNLVSQLTLVARNAERHADNPAFRADMVVTLQESAGRMNDLLARLSQHHAGRVDPPVAVEIVPLLECVARRRPHPVIVSGAHHLFAIADPARLEQALGHLVQNAIEASAADMPVTLSVAEAPGRLLIEVGDRGLGMSAAFVRDRLFRPFVSNKPGGFGIGAFEARQLIEAMGGILEVASAEGQGTRFTLTLALALAGATAGAAAPPLEQAA